MAERTVAVKLTADVSNYMSGMRQAGTGTTLFASGIEKGVKKN